MAAKYIENVKTILIKGEEENIEDASLLLTDLIDNDSKYFKKTFDTLFETVISIV
jgi:hypothetical protein